MEVTITFWPDETLYIKSLSVSTFILYSTLLGSPLTIVYFNTVEGCAVHMIKILS